MVARAPASPKAEIIAIGTEILLGEIQDSNSRFIARALRDLGIDLYWTSTVGDNAARIAQAVQLALTRSQVVITTGGLGPTIDDATREGIAGALGVALEFRPELWEQVLERYRNYGRVPTENNRRQALVPEGALAVRNPVGTAPAFIVESGRAAVIALPGVPREMEYLLQNVVLGNLRERYDLREAITIRVLHTAGAGESQIDERLSDLETLSNPTVGLAAHTGQVDVRIAAKAATAEQALKLIEPVEAEVRSRLGEWVYGADEDTLESVALAQLRARGLKLVVVESGLGCALVHRLVRLPDTFLQGQILPEGLPAAGLLERTRSLLEEHAAQVGLGVALIPAGERQELHFALATHAGEQTQTQFYGGPPGYAPRWGANLGLDLLRGMHFPGESS